MDLKKYSYAKTLSPQSRAKEPAPLVLIKIQSPRWLSEAGSARIFALPSFLLRVRNAQLGIGPCGAAKIRCGGRQSGPFDCVRTSCVRSQVRCRRQLPASQPRKDFAESAKQKYEVWGIESSLPLRPPRPAKHFLGLAAASSELNRFFSPGLVLSGGGRGGWKAREAPSQEVFNITL